MESTGVRASARFRALAMVGLGLLHAAAFGADAPATAAPPVDPVLEALIAPEGFLSVTLSPDGKRLAALGYNGIGTGVFVGDVETLKFSLVVDNREVSNSRGWYGRHPTSVRWIDDELLAVDYNDLDAEATEVTGRKVKRIGDRFLSSVPAPDGGTGRWALVVLETDSQRIGLVDPRTGERKRFAGNPPGRLVGTAYDRQGQLRAAVTLDTTFWTARSTLRHWYRSSPDAEWQLLRESPVTEEGWQPIYVPDEPDTLVVRSRAGRDTWALFRYDVRRKAETELLAGHPTEDVSGAAGIDQQVFTNVRTLGLKPTTHWFDARWAALQASVDKALPGRSNGLSGQPGGRVLVRSASDVDPGRWYLLDTAAMTMKPVAERSPKVRPELLRPMQTLRYRARDGLDIPAYLTLPEGTGPWPLVVLVHGGPAVRDTWSYDPEVQWLAHLGHAVLQPQFRGSSGFGAAFEAAGRGQWGRAMQDDVSDGVKHLVERGIADARRVCIYGASYGGYAALWGLVKTPELYRCAISYAGVTDIDQMLRESDIARSPAKSELFRFGVGLSGDDRNAFAPISPLQQAAKIRAPVLLGHGRRDARVPVGQGQRMVEALKKAGVEHQWLEFEREGHSLDYIDNRRRWYQAVQAFLAKHLAPPTPADGTTPTAASR